MSVKTQIIDMNVLRHLLAGQREDLRIGVFTKEEVMKILRLGRSEFYKELNNPESLIRRSTKQGRFIASSVIREFERIHGVPYKDAVVDLTG